jgi:hypothetical protein
MPEFCKLFSAAFSPAGYWRIRSKTVVFAYIPRQNALSGPVLNLLRTARQRLACFREIVNAVGLRYLFNNTNRCKLELHSESTAISSAIE